MADTFSTNEKSALLLFATVGIVYFFFVKEKIKLPVTSNSSVSGTSSADGTQDNDPGSRKHVTVPTIDKKQIRSKKVFDAFNALKAYVLAYNAGESMQDLNQMAKDINRRYSVKVYKRPDGKFAVSDGNGKDIIVHTL